MSSLTPPAGLNEPGQALWSDVADAYDLDPVQLVTLEAACLMRDRVVQLRSGAVSGDDRTIRQERDAALAMARLLAALRLPDASSGKVPQRRSIRGVQKPSGKGVARDKLRAVPS